MKYSFIIISYNEEETIIKAIRSIKRNEHQTEIIVADGGSNDGTVELAEHEDVIICHSELGRGIQFNTASKIASGDILIFMHADSELPENTFGLLSKFEKYGMKVGTFLLGFDYTHPVLKLYSWFSRFDSLFTTFGDSCIIVRKTFFENLGRFRNWGLFEDVDFFRRARKLTKIYLLKGKVITSARRFLEDGLIMHQIKSAYYLLQFIWGIHPDKIAPKYDYLRKRRTNPPDSDI